MQRYVVRRLLQIPPLLVLISIFTFAMLHLVPGGPLTVYARGGVNPQALASLRAQLGLDEPLPIQYFHWLGRAVHGDFGSSLVTNQTVFSAIGGRVGPTVLLMGLGLVISVLLAIPLGVLQATRQYSRTDITFTTLSFVGSALPPFLVGLVLIILDVNIRNPATGAPFLPVSGMDTVGVSSIGDVALHLPLPLIALCLPWISWYSRYVRSSMLDVIHQDYIRTARAKGLRGHTVVFKHAFKNASIPLITVMALDLPGLIGGALFVEIIFGWPGLGQFLYYSLTRRDYPVVLALVLLTGLFVIIANLIADLVYAYADPRIRYGAR